MLVMLMCVSVGAWAADVLKTSVSFNSWEVGNTSYNSTEWSDKGCTFAYAANNNKGWEYLRMGGKSANPTNSYVKFNTAIDGKTSKVVLHHEGKSNNALTINSITVTAYSDSDFKTQIGNKTVNNECSESGDVTIVPDAAWATGAYLKIIVNWTGSAKNNYGLNVTGFDVYIQSNKLEPGISFSESSCVVTMGKENSFPTLSNSNSLTVAYSSSNTDVATVNASTGAITLINPGTTTITATSAEDATYAAGTTSYTLKVLEAINLTSKVVVDEWASLSYGNEGVYITDGVSLLVNQGAMNNKALQLKANEGYVVSPTINAPFGYTVTVTFASQTNEASITEVQINEETPVSVTGKTPLIATTSATVSSFKISNTNTGIAQIATITIAPSSADITISAAGYTTYYNSTAAYTMPDDCEGYVFTADGGLELAYEAEEVVPAGEPLVIYTIEPGIKTLVFTTSEENTWKEINMNDLDGTDAETALTADENSYFYGLSLNAAGETASVGFYWMNETGAAFTNGAHKAYLKLPKSSSARSGFAFNEDTEAISTIEAEVTATTTYNLAGQRVNDAKGLVIKNGKKIFVK